MPATAVRAVTPADVPFRLLFRHKQHLVAADRQRKAAVALENNLLRLVIGMQKSGLERGGCDRVRLFNLTDINENTLA